MNDYSDIINLPRPISKTHPPMSLENRSAQFAPFAALTGHKETIQNAEEQEQISFERIIISTDEDPEENQINK